MIRIAIGAPLSGASALLGAEMKQAAELAIEERNSAGGIAGMPVAAEAGDDEGRTDSGEAVARRFCANPEVLGVVGHYNSDVTIAAAPVYHACELAMITPIASNPAVTDSGLRNVFRFTNRDDETGAAIADHLFRTLGKRRAVVVETATLYGQSMANEFTRAFTRRGGGIVAHHRVRDGERDFGALVESLPAGFDLLFYGGSFEGAPILKAMRAAGRHQLFAAGDGCWDVRNFLEPANPVITEGEGVLVLSATPEVGRVAGAQAFADRYAQRYGPIGNYAANCYDSACLLLAAIERAAAEAAGVPSRSDVLAAVRASRFQGIAYPGPVEWDAKGDNLSAVTALHIAERDRFREVAEIGQMRLAA